MATLFVNQATWDDLVDEFNKTFEQPMFSSQMPTNKPTRPAVIVRVMEDPRMPRGGFEFL